MLLHVHEWGDAEAPRVVCIHGVSAHGRRYRRLAEERLAARFHVLAPDLRGHGLSGWEPPWNLETHLEDVLETVGDEPSVWVGHSFGGRLVLELAARRRQLVPRAVLLDPAIDILPHVGFDFAQNAATEREFTSPDEAIDARLMGESATPREAIEEEAREHLAQLPSGVWRWRYSRAAVTTMYSELCRTPPPPAVLRDIPTLLLYAEHFGLVREEQLEEYRAVLSDGLELVGVAGGHVVYWDAFEETADALEEFLTRHSPVSHP